MTAPQPAWVLSRKAHGDNGLVVEFFTAEWGRCGAVVRGAHRKKRGGSFAALLQPFQPLLISLVGKGELKNLRQAEAPSARVLLKGESLISGLYLNELLSRVVPRFDVMPSVFVEYSRTVENLYGAPIEGTLRRFELLLLAEMGYRINLLTDEHGESIRPLVHYRFEVERGFCAAKDRLLAPRPDVMTGEQIHRTMRWLEDGAELPEADAAALKQITRVALSRLTAGRRIHTRELVRDLRSHQRRPI
jgi:DNA repair protein RecO (recombination protein O)